mmetsp:Transcript_5116/g.10005  ORF Transcript_5116/g.10005 Transcript_5116/m.10005 type:complete len:289 (+) Transcript_5116:187-1053(+)
MRRRTPPGPVYEAPWGSTSGSVLASAGGAVGAAISAGGASTPAIGAGGGAGRDAGRDARGGAALTGGGHVGTAAYMGTCTGMPAAWCICTPAWCCICTCCCCCSACCCCTTEHVRDLWPMPPQTEQRWALFLRHEGPFSGAPMAKAAPMPGIPGRRLACVLATISFVPCNWVIALVNCSLKSSKFLLFGSSASICSIRSRWAVHDWRDDSRFWAVASSSTIPVCGGTPAECTSTPALPRCCFRGPSLAFVSAASAPAGASAPEPGAASPLAVSAPAATLPGCCTSNTS